MLQATASTFSSFISNFHLIVKVGGCVAEENILNMNAINYGLVHGNQVSQKIFYIHQQSTLCILAHSYHSEFLWNIPTCGNGTFVPRGISMW